MFLLLVVDFTGWPVRTYCDYNCLALRYDVEVGQVMLSMWNRFGIIWCRYDFSDGSVLLSIQKTWRRLLHTKNFAATQNNFLIFWYLQKSQNETNFPLKPSSIVRSYTNLNKDILPCSIIFWCCLNKRIKFIPFFPFKIMKIHTPFRYINEVAKSSRIMKCSTGPKPRWYASEIRHKEDSSLRRFQNPKCHKAKTSLRNVADFRIPHSTSCFIAS